MTQNKMKWKIAIGSVLMLSVVLSSFAQHGYARIIPVSWLSDKSRNTNYSDDCSDNSVYKKMTALRLQYPEGMNWTNDNKYSWKGGIYSSGRGCLGFAFILSDAAFGELPARKHHDFNNLRIGDILRINNDSHSVIILCVDNSTVTVAEGNYNSAIHWGRTFSRSLLKSKLNYVMTRYPD